MFRLAAIRSFSVGQGSILSRSSLQLPKVMKPMVRYNSTRTDIDRSLEIQHKLTPVNTEALDAQVSSMSSDQIGYLDSIGLAQGYGPTALIERLLEVSHVYSGLPWWGTIIAVTVATRLILFPLYVKSSINAAKMSEIKPQLDEIMNDLRRAESPQEQVQAAHRRKALMKDHDIHISHQILPLVQLPIAYGFFQATRKMANFPVDGFQDQGYAWFQDLTQVDPYCGLQIIAAALVVYMVRLGGETGAAAMNPMVKKVMTYVPIFSIFVTKELSAAVVLYFAANGSFSFIQAMVLRNKLFRKFAKMPPIKSNPAATINQPQTVREWWKDFNKNMNNNVEKKMKTTNSKLGAIEKKKNGANGGFVRRH